MHSEMSERPTITVGRAGADLIGADNRALQAAVDYVAGLGGGVVEIGEGEYLMRDSLHLRSDVTVRGRKGKTILRKADGAVSPLALDGDFGEQQITVKDPAGFAVGAGVAIWDDHAGGFHTTVARITGRRGNTFSIDAPLMADCMVADHAKAATVFPVVSGTDIQGARVEDLVIEGNKAANPPLNGCRGAGIYLYRGFGTIDPGLRRAELPRRRDQLPAVERRDGRRLRQRGQHRPRPPPRQRLATPRRPRLRGPAQRHRRPVPLLARPPRRVRGQPPGGQRPVRHLDRPQGLRQPPASATRSSATRSNGVFFRDEAGGMSPHRNRLEDNRIEDNGREAGTAGIRVRGEPSGLVFEDNVIRDTRAGSQRTQTVGILVEDRVGPVEIGTNRIEASTVDRRPTEVGLSISPHSRFATGKAVDTRLNNYAAPTAPSRGTSSRRPPSTPPRTASPPPRR